MSLENEIKLLVGHILSGEKHDQLRNVDDKLVVPTWGKNGLREPARPFTQDEVQATRNILEPLE